MEVNDFKTNGMLWQQTNSKQACVQGIFIEKLRILICKYKLFRNYVTTLLSDYYVTQVGQATEIRPFVTLLQLYYSTLPDHTAGFLRITEVFLRT